MNGLDVIQVLRLATEWGFARIRKECIEVLDASFDCDNILSRIWMGELFRVEKWLSDGMKALTFRDDAISVSDAMSIGTVLSVKITECREKRFRAAIPAKNRDAQSSKADARTVKDEICEHIDQWIVNDFIETDKIVDFESRKKSKGTTNNAGPSHSFPKERDDGENDCLSGHSISETIKASSTSTKEPRWSQSRLGARGETNSPDTSKNWRSKTKSEKV